MLYTTHLRKLSTIPKHAFKFVITRFEPDWLNTENYENLYILKSLSPEPGILLDYKRTNDWDKFVKRFTNQLKTHKSSIKSLELLRDLLRCGEDVFLVCYEKDYLRCHRSLVAQELGNYKWREWDEEYTEWNEDEWREWDE